jgi:hypothetical protein
VTLTITGTNDAAVIAGNDQGSVTEDATTPTITDSGTLTITDVDLNEATFVAESLSGTWGGLSIDTTGNWSYAALYRSGRHPGTGRWLDADRSHYRSGD